MSQGLGCLDLAADIILDIPTDLETINKARFIPTVLEGNYYDNLV